ncbi:MAG TPA: radical SAM protein [Hyphomicrobiales bacterium]|nr:radical SAM protein [Hyphomicrobiales bacterium]
MPIVEAQSAVLVFGGPYSNLQATRAVLREAQRRGIAPSSIICTGDLAAYCGSPAETIALIRDAQIHTLMGNCDEQLALNAKDCGCGFQPGTACERLSASWYAFASERIGPQLRQWLATLPRRIDVVMGNRRLAVTHATISEINRFVFASTSSAIKKAELDLSGCDGVIAGHCGLPFTEAVGGRLWHNAGVIGMPANDGTPSTWYSILTLEKNVIRIEHCALTYDRKAAQAAMRDAGLGPEYREALETGLWPSEDVLGERERRLRGRALPPGSVLWGSSSDGVLWPFRERDEKGVARPLSRKFADLRRTATGEKRAKVPLKQLETLWFNTGTLCNIACEHCYIESSPRNDRLAYLTLADVTRYLDEIESAGEPVSLLGFTGGEPFMNPNFLAILGEALSRGYQTLTLTNAMKPMVHKKAQIAALSKRYGGSMRIRVSLDDFRQEIHDKERGEGSFEQTLQGLCWLGETGVCVEVAGRSLMGEAEETLRPGYAALFAERGIKIDCFDPQALLILPEMKANDDPPEITESCWSILGKSPGSLMCANARMIVKRKGAQSPAVLACTLIPYDKRFELGTTLAEARRPVPLAHPYCASFCVLGGGSCGSLRA